MRRMDQLKSMRIFVKVIDEGSFAGAARAMDTATSAVTRAIADLESSLGSRLLNRTTRTLSLTDVGAAYLERVRSILEDLDDANAQAAFQVGDGTRDGRGRRVHGARGTGETAFVDDLDEDAHALELVHAPHCLRTARRPTAAAECRRFTTATSWRSSARA